MKPKPLPLAYAVSVLLAAGIWLAACAGTAQNPISTFDLDPLFTEFYALLGSEAILGPAISPLFQYNQLQCQYLENALLCHNPDNAIIDQFNIYPLGGAMGIADAPLSIEAPSGQRVVDGYIIHTDFVPLYDQLYGARYVGRPLTQARVNTPLQRVEQYFDNVGFYHRFNDPPGVVHLLSYGVYACGTGCVYPASAESQVTLALPSYTQPFLSALYSFNGIPAFGDALGEPFMNTEGNWEQVFRHVAISAPPDQPALASLRPLSLLLEKSASAPHPEMYGESDGVVFIPTSGNLGYHVPIAFDNFVRLHGGYEVSGLPISEAVDNGGGIYRQCFTNYCLDYMSQSTSGSLVRMVELGVEYQAWVAERLNAPGYKLRPSSVVLQLSESYASVTTDATQQINLVLLNAETQQGLSNVEAILTVFYPDKSTYSVHMPPTSLDGASSVMVPPRTGTPNGSIILYEVCLNVPSDEPICAEETYLIWNN